MPRKTQSNQGPYLTVPEYAAMHGVHPQTVRDWYDAGLFHYGYVRRPSCWRRIHRNAPPPVGKRGERRQGVALPELLND